MLQNVGTVRRLAAKWLHYNAMQLITLYHLTLKPDKYGF